MRICFSLFYSKMLKIKERSTVYAYSISVCMGSFVFGYQLTNMSFFGDLLISHNDLTNQTEISDSLTLVKSVLALAAIFGTLAFKPITNAWGFIQTFRIFDFLTIVGCIIGILNLSIGTQVVSRLILGVVVGMNTAAIPVYLTSCLPGSMGGPAGTLNQLFITIGIFFGFFVSYIIFAEVDSTLGWRLIIALPIIPTLIRLYTTKNVYPYETVERMIQLDDDLALRSYLNLIYEPISIEDYKLLKKLPNKDIVSQNASFFDPKGQPYRRRLFMASGIVLFNVLSGGGALGAWSGSKAFSQLFGENAVLTGFVYLNLVQVIVTFFSGQFLERWGRRAFMMEGQRVIIVTLLLIGFLETFQLDLYYFTVPLVFIHMIGFSLSYGPCSFLIGTQILHDATYPSLILWAGIFLFGLMNSAFIEIIGVGPLCLIYFIFQILGFLYVSSNLVETQGRSRQDVYEQFRSQCPHYDNIPKRQFQQQHPHQQLEMKFIDKQKQEDF